MMYFLRVFFFLCVCVCLFGHCHTQTEANVKVLVHMFVLLSGYTVAAEVGSSVGRLMY